MAEHTIKMVPNVSPEVTKAIFALHSAEAGAKGILNDDNVLDLCNIDGTLRVVNKDGIELGKLPTGHPFNEVEPFPSLRIATYKVIGRLDEPTLPRLHLRIIQKVEA